MCVAHIAFRMVGRSGTRLLCRALGVGGVALALTWAWVACGLTAEDGLRPAPNAIWSGAAPGATAGPMSGDCQEMRAKLRWQYESVRRCSNDAECNYIEGFFEVVPRSDVRRSITRMDCRLVTPLLVVANGAKLLTVMDGLEREAALEGQACAPTPDPIASDYPCDARRTFVSSLPPICAAGLCQLPAGEPPLAY